MSQDDSGTGKIYTSCFLSFNEVHPKLPDADWIAVTRTWGFKRGSGESAELRRKHIRWMPQLSPSRKLRLRYMKKENGNSWTEFIEQYLDELFAEQETKDLLEELAGQVAAGRTIVLMCYEKAGEKCHRKHLCKVIDDRARIIIADSSGVRRKDVRTLAGGELCPSPKTKRGKNR